jgi:hypothetical protein
MYKLGCIFIGFGTALAVALFVTLESLRHTFPTRFIQKLRLGDQTSPDEFLTAFRLGIGQFYSITKIIYIPIALLVCGGLLVVIAGRSKQREMRSDNAPKVLPSGGSQRPQ